VLRHFAPLDFIKQVQLPANMLQGGLYLAQILALYQHTTIKIRAVLSFTITFITPYEIFPAVLFGPHCGFAYMGFAIQHAVGAIGYDTNFLLFPNISFAVMPAGYPLKKLKSITIK
jgi:hypothetical protein